MTKVDYEPDILAKGLDVIFCGLNPAATAAASGHNFSNASNRFWRVLHLAGFTDRRLEPEEEHRLLEYGCGITAVVRRPTSRAQEISAQEFKQAAAAFETKIRHYGPRAVAFLGKRALSIIASQSEVAWGRQSLSFGGAVAWALPNPSGLNRNFSLATLVRAYAELRHALPGTLCP